MFEGLLKIRPRINSLTRKPSPVAKPAIHGALGTYEEDTPVWMPLQKYRGNRDIIFTERVLNASAPFLSDRRYSLSFYGTTGVIIIYEI